MELEAKTILAEGRYFRLQAPLLRGYDDFDNVDATNLLALRRTAEDYLATPDVQRSLDRLVALL